MPLLIAGGIFASHINTNMQRAWNATLSMDDGMVRAMGNHRNDNGTPINYSNFRGTNRQERIGMYAQHFDGGAGNGLGYNYYAGSTKGVISPNTFRGQLVTNIYIHSGELKIEIHNRHAKNFFAYVTIRGSFGGGVTEITLHTNVATYHTPTAHTAWTWQHGLQDLVANSYFTVFFTY